MSQSTEGHTLIIQIRLDNSNDALRYKIDQMTIVEGKVPTAQIHFDCLHCRAKYFISPKIVQLTELKMIPDEKQAIEVKKEPEFDWLESGSSSDCGNEEQDIGHEMHVASNDHIKEERELNQFEPGSSDELLSDDEADTLQGVEQESPVAPVNNLEIQPPEIVENENPIRTQPLYQQPFVRLIRIDPETKDQSQHNVQLQKKKDVDSDNKETQGEPDLVETPPVMHQMRSEQTSGSKESEEAREVDASVAHQERNVESFYQCDICNASIKYRYNLTRHMKIHMGIRFSCSECSKSFSQKVQLAAHKKLVHQSELRICEVCRRSKTWTKAEYYSHLRHRHPKFHIKVRHPKVQNFNVFVFPCNYCEPQLTFEGFEELKEHLRVTHDRKFACARCPKAFNQNCHLKAHIDTVHKKIFR